MQAAATALALKRVPSTNGQVEAFILTGSRFFFVKA
jgi:hypothetical protein